jgi:hypothetical protein
MCAESGAWNFKEADVLIKKSWVAAISSMTLLAACTQGPSLNGSAPAPSGGTASPAVASLPGGSGPVTIHCGDGKQALVKQVILGGQTASQVECVDMARTVVSRDVALLEDEPLVVAPPPPPVRRVVRTLPPVRERVIVREIPAPRHEDDVVVVQDEEPRVVRTSTTDRDDYEPPPSTTQGRKRPGEESAAIIVGSTGAGAGIGAIIGGKKGAIIGAVLGGVGGTIFDRKTRNKK